MIEFILHIDQYLDVLIQNYGVGVYVILFLIVFLETGLVALPFLPGDSLLFAAGAFAARGSLDFWLLFTLLSVAAIVGDTFNYGIGRVLGPKVFRKEEGLLFRREYLEKTRLFYEKHGPKTIVLARFLPILRTFAPFIAGIGHMSYPRFLFYNILGGVFWVVSMTGAGYLFGNIPLVRDNFSIVVITIIVISLIPIAWEMISHRWHAKKVA